MSRIMIVPFTFRPISSQLKGLHHKWWDGDWFPSHCCINVVRQTVTMTTMYVKNFDDFLWWRYIDANRKLHGYNQVWPKGQNDNIDDSPWWQHMITYRTLHQRNHPGHNCKAEWIDHLQWWIRMKNYRLHQSNITRSRDKPITEQKKPWLMWAQAGKINECQDLTRALLTTKRAGFNYRIARKDELDPMKCQLTDTTILITRTTARYELHMSTMKFILQLPYRQCWWN